MMLKKMKKAEALAMKRLVRVGRSTPFPPYTVIAQLPSKCLPFPLRP